MDTTGIDIVTIDGVVYDIPDDPSAAVYNVMFRERGLKTTLGSRLHPDYVRPDDTLDDAL